jgi:hypothetical protein
MDVAIGCIVVLVLVVLYMLYDFVVNEADIELPNPLARVKASGAKSKQASSSDSKGS